MSVIRQATRLIAINALHWTSDVLSISSESRCRGEVAQQDGQEAKRSRGATAAEGGNESRYAVEKVGALSLGTPVGDGPRGSQSERQCLGLPDTRPGALTRLSVGRGRAGGDL